MAGGDRRTVRDAGDGLHGTPLTAGGSQAQVVRVSDSWAKVQVRVGSQWPVDWRRWCLAAESACAVDRLLPVTIIRPATSRSRRPACLVPPWSRSDPGGRSGFPGAGARGARVRPDGSRRHGRGRAAFTAWRRAGARAGRHCGGRSGTAAAPADMTSHGPAGLCPGTLRSAAPNPIEQAPSTTKAALMICGSAASSAARPLS
jgi:hypothetical protein